MAFTGQRQLFHNPKDLQRLEPNPIVHTQSILPGLTAHRTYAHFRCRVKSVNTPPEKFPPARLQPLPASGSHSYAGNTPNSKQVSSGPLEDIKEKQKQVDFLQSLSCFRHKYCAFRLLSSQMILLLLLVRLAVTQPSSVS